VWNAGKIACVAAFPLHVIDGTTKQQNTKREHEVQEKEVTHTVT
jgi:hypothetical protein